MRAPGGGLAGGELPTSREEEATALTRTNVKKNRSLRRHMARELAGAPSLGVGGTDDCVSCGVATPRCV